MIPIYKRDGTVKYLSRDEVEVLDITPDSIDRLKNEDNGVRIFYKNGRSSFINNAETDGIAVTISE